MLERSWPKDFRMPKTVRKDHIQSLFFYKTNQFDMLLQTPKITLVAVVVSILELFPQLFVRRPGLMSNFRDLLRRLEEAHDQELSQLREAPGSSPCRVIQWPMAIWIVFVSTYLSQLFRENMGEPRTIAAVNLRSSDRHDGRVASRR